MRNQEIIVSLDIGTTSIKVVVAEYVNGQANIIGVGNEKSRGLSRGVIVDIDETVYSIQQAIAQAERKANVKINEVVVGIPSNKISIESCHGMIAVSSENREISERDVDNVISAAKVRSIPPEREIIAILPEEFIVDGFNGIRDPRGMIGVRLELFASLITGPKTIIHNIKRCVEKAGLVISEMVIQPQAISQVALSKDEREFGTVIIDMGGGQTSASIIYDNQLKYSFVDQEGGDFVTKDISIILNTSLDSAERIKREFGYALPEQTSDEEYFPVETVGKKEPVRVDERYLSEIIEARLSQIFETIKEDLSQVDALDLPGGFVLTGGAASLPGILELAQRHLGSKVRLYIPNQMGMRNPVFTTSMGMVEYVASLDEVHRIAQATFRSKKVMQQPVAPSRPRELPNQSVQDNDYEEYQVQYEPDSERNPNAQAFSNVTGKTGSLFSKFKEKAKIPSKPNRLNKQEDFYDTYDSTDSIDDSMYYDETSNNEEDFYSNQANTQRGNGNDVTSKLRNFFSTFFD